MAEPDRQRPMTTTGQMLEWLRRMGFKPKGYSLRSPWSHRPYVVVSPQEFDELREALDHPARPTPSIIRAAELIRTLYHGDRP